MNKLIERQKHSTNNCDARVEGSKGHSCSLYPQKNVDNFSFE